MKLLMIYADRFAYKTTIKTLETVPEINEEKSFKDALVGFIQVEQADENDAGYAETKLVKNIKWAARKNSTKRIILHSFAHLSESKAAPEITRQLFDDSQKRLEDAGYEVYQTPFGYFLDLDLQAPGKSLARIFKDIRTD